MKLKKVERRFFEGRFGSLGNGIMAFAHHLGVKGRSSLCLVLLRREVLVQDSTTQCKGVVLFVEDAHHSWVADI